MKLNRELKLEGIIIGVCFVLMCIGLILRYGPYYGLNPMLWIFVIITSSPLFVIVVAASSLYWIGKARKYQRTI